MSTWYLAWRYVSRHRIKAAVLVAALALSVFLPAATTRLVEEGEAYMRARAVATPLLVGAEGSRADLVLHSLYFGGRAPDPISMAEVERVRASELAEAVPLFVRFQAREHPVVGTSLAYFDLRGLDVAEGSGLARLGDCLLGARVAESLGLGPGDALLSDPENVFDLAGAYPLRMRVAGVLAPSHSPDDYAVFVDLKTAWVIAGIGHGHEDITESDTDAGVILRREGGEVVANAALPQFREITEENIGSFHFHGDPAGFPLTAVIVLPDDRRAATLLRGRYDTDPRGAQLLAPADVIDELMAMVFQVKRLLDAVSIVTAMAMGLLIVLVVLLSVQLRRGEMRTMARLGCSRFTMARLIAAELVMVAAGSAVLALPAAWSLHAAVPALIQRLLG